MIEHYIVFCSLQSQNQRFLSLHLFVSFIPRCFLPASFPTTAHSLPSSPPFLFLSLPLLSWPLSPLSPSVSAAMLSHNSVTSRTTLLAGLLAGLLLVFGIHASYGGRPAAGRRHQNHHLRRLGMAVKKVSKERVRSGRGLFPSCSDLVSCCKGSGRGWDIEREVSQGLAHFA